MDILRLLSLGDKHLSVFDISLRFTHLFWCGDLNYRLDLDVQVRYSINNFLLFIALIKTPCSVLAPLKTDFIGHVV